MNQGLSYEIAQVMPQAFGTGLFASLASFVEPVRTQGPTGNSTGGYLPLAGLQNIPAMNAPQSMMTVSSGETRALPNVEAERIRHMLLNGYFPSLDTGFAQGAGMGWEVSIQDPNGNVSLFDFLGGEADSQSQMTRIKMQLVTV